MMDGAKKPGSIRNAESLKKDGVTFVGESTVTGIDYDDKRVIIDKK